MKTWLIILIVFLVIIFIAGIIVLLYFLKKKKDIKDMKKNLAKLVKSFGTGFGTCKESTKYADCAVDKLIDAFGYITVKELNNKGWDPKTFFKKKSDQNKGDNIMNKCYTSYCK
jgi:hypothetical protein